MNLLTDGVCELCRIELKNRYHLFLLCPYTQEVWYPILQALKLQKPCSCGWANWMQWFTKVSEGKTALARRRRSLMAWLVYKIWMERNRRVFRNKEPNTTELARKLITGVMKLGST